MSSIESRFHEWLHESQNDSSIDIRDDAAYYPNSNHPISLSAKDLFVEDLHFRRSYWSYEDIGYKACLRSISDLYAMDGKPEHILLGISHTKKQDLEELKKITTGVRQCCIDYNCKLVGGDTNENGSRLFLSVTALGGTELPILQSTAKEGDTIYFCGELALPFLSLHHLENSIDLPRGLEIKDFFRPLLPISSFESFKNRYPVNALTDVTDGLIEELTRIGQKSKVSSTVDFEKIVSFTNLSHLRIAKDLGLPLTEVLLKGGEEYGFLFTSPHYVEDFTHCYPIGSIRDRTLLNEVILPDQGPKDFSSF